MPEFDEDGKFAGLSKEEKAIAVLEHLSTDGEITIGQLVEKTGLSLNQVHAGIRHLREARNCVVTTTRGQSTPTYKLAADAPEVREYATRRMQHWQSQIGVIRKEMELAQQLGLPDAQCITVQKATECLTSLIRTLELDEAWRKQVAEERKQAEKEAAKREKDMARREAKLKEAKSRDRHPRVHQGVLV